MADQYASVSPQPIDFSRGAENAMPCIFSLSGYEVTAQERALFAESNPLGFILFKRNCDTPAQIAALTQDLREIVGRNCPILIDQEGGRVQRLRPPQWRDYKPMQYYGDVFRDTPEHALEELRFDTLRLSEELIAAGVNVDCAPVLDLIFDGAHDIIGDRSFAADPAIVARLGLSVCRHFLSVGITPIIKHIPGHGRAVADSHLELPVVRTPYEELARTDFAPFRDLAQSDIGHMVWAMTAHIVYDSIDTELPVSISKPAIEQVIRGDIGFDGIVIGDDLDMKALDTYGTVSERAKQSLAAGCDLALYCAGEFAAMESLAQALPPMAQATLRRLHAAAHPQRQVA